MRIDRKLNFIVPIKRDDGVIYVHATPLHREVFERYFLVLSKTFAAIYSHGGGLISGPRIAQLMLKRIAIADGVWDGEDGVAEGLMAEIGRTANLIAPSGSGWSTMPLHDALEKKLLDEDELAEVQGMVTFFIVASAMHTREELPGILESVARMWNAQTSFSNCTAFAASLPTSTVDETSGVKETASFIPQ